MSKIGGALTSAIQCIAPPLTAIGAWFFLGEELSSGKAFGLLLTCLAVSGLVVLERRSRVLDQQDVGLARLYVQGLMAAGLAALCQAIGVLISRRPLEDLTPAQGAAYRLLLPVLILAVWEKRRHGLSAAAFVRSSIKMPNAPLLAVAAFLGTYLGLMLMVYGMTHAPVGIALAINSTYPVWIAFFEWLLWKRRLSSKSLICLLLAIGGIFAMVY